MADFDGVITPVPAMTDVPSLGVTARALGGPSGPMNSQAQALANRIEYQRSQLSTPGNVSGGGLVAFIADAAGAKADNIQNQVRERLSLTQFLTDAQRMNSFLRTGNIDLGQAIDDWLSECISCGAAPYVPRGVYATTRAHAYTVVGGAVSCPYGDGPTASIFMAMGNQDVLTISGASQLSVRGIGFDKVSRNYLGRGLVIKNTAYALIEHVTAFGFLNGCYTQDVLTSLFSRCLFRFNDIGQVFDFGTISSPNAITCANCTWSLNNRFGLRANQPAGLFIMGGSLEGNGWGQTSFNGGMYISNAGLEGGVGLVVSGLHMEQNRGTADIWIASTANAGTTYIIENSSIFPIDDTNFTANRIYFENSVQQNLKLRGNAFKHFGSYTPNAARKYVAAVDTTLLSIDTGGDCTQFFSPVETPDLKSWGPNVIREAMASAHCTVSNSGTIAALGGGAYNVASVTRSAAGRMVCNFVRPMVNTLYRVSPTPDTGGKSAPVCTLKTLTSFTIEIRDLSGNLSDSGFDAIVFGGVN